jgi:hypothetical protein
LNSYREDPRGNDVVRRSLTDDPGINMMSLGCPSCPHFAECGGLHVEAPLLDCLSLCCGNPEECSRVCRNKSPEFVAQIREIGGFNLGNTRRAPARPLALCTSIAELIYHGSRREALLRVPTLALRLADVVDYRLKRARFATRNEMCVAFKIDPVCNIILTGVDHDARIEPWWSLGHARITVIRSLVHLGIALVTTPNFSLLLDNPRPDDLHAMKRIAIIFAEFQQEGLACALHPNARTMRDFERWKGFIATRPEVSTLAYEFITGSGRSARRQFHLDGLIDIAKTVDRPLDIVVRGDPQVIPSLRTYYREVIYIDTTAFIKAQKRRLAERSMNDVLEWNRSYTEPGGNLDRILRINIEEQSVYLRAKYFGDAIRRDRVA